MRSRVYTEIRNRLLEKLPQLQYVDLQKGQFDKPQQNYPIPLPAALIEIKPKEWSNAATGNQMGETIVSIYLYHDLVTDSFNGAEQEAETIKLLDTQDDVFQALECFDSDEFQPLSRISEHEPYYGDRYVCFGTDFKTLLYAELQEAKSRLTPKPRPNFKLS